MILHRWKLLLFPNYLEFPASVRTSLPQGLSVDQVLKDMLVYMIDNLKVHVERAHPVMGIWEILRNDMELVLTTPNGWEGQQQHRMRRAAIEAGIIREDEGRKVKFVSEGEVSYTAVLIDHFMGTDFLFKGYRALLYGTS